MYETLAWGKQVDLGTVSKVCIKCNTDRLIVATIWGYATYMHSDIKRKTTPSKVLLSKLCWLTFPERVKL